MCYLRWQQVQRRRFMLYKKKKVEGHGAMLCTQLTQVKFSTPLSSAMSNPCAESKVGPEHSLLWPRNHKGKSKVEAETWQWNQLREEIYCIYRGSSSCPFIHGKLTKWWPHMLNDGVLVRSTPWEQLQTSAVQLWSHMSGWHWFLPEWSATLVETGHLRASLKIEIKGKLKETRF